MTIQQKLHAVGVTCVIAAIFGFAGWSIHCWVSSPRLESWEEGGRVNYRPPGQISQTEINDKEQATDDLTVKTERIRWTVETLIAWVAQSAGSPLRMDEAKELLAMLNGDRDTDITATRSRPRDRDESSQALRERDK